MHELGHDHVDILKVDVEGSEYMFLQEAIDDGSLERVHQMTIEWHHFDYDPRYGGGSSPQINTIVAFLFDLAFNSSLFTMILEDGRASIASFGNKVWVYGISWPALSKSRKRRLDGQTK
jgi:hypothetical protein